MDAAPLFVDEEGGEGEGGGWVAGWLSPLYGGDVGLGGGVWREEEGGTEDTHSGKPS